MKTVEEKYKEYLTATDTEKVINGELFYKAVDVSLFRLAGKPTISIILPYKMFFQDSRSKKIMNVDGEVFNIIGPAHCRFTSAEIPQWYTECGNYLIEDFEDPKGDIGYYFKSVKETQI